MRVFVTGAAGFIGQVVVQELLNSGHQVLGLARSEASAKAIIQAGAEPHSGDLEDIDSLTRAAKSTDGIIHLAFIHDFNNFAKAAAVDQAAITAMGEAIAGTKKPLIIASGTLFLPKGQIGDEDTEPERNTPLAVRALSADLVYSLSKEKNVRGMVVRLPPTVHGKGDKGMIPMFMDMARKNGFVTYVGNGSARWPTCHRTDAAVLFRLAVESGAAGATYHAVAEQGVQMKDIMTVVGKGLQLPVESKSPEGAVEAMGMFGHLIDSDNPTSSERTQKELGWHPSQMGLLEDLEANYFT